MRAIFEWHDADIGRFRLLHWLSKVCLLFSVDARLSPSRGVSGAEVPGRVTRVRPWELVQGGGGELSRQLVLHSFFFIYFLFDPGLRLTQNVFLKYRSNPPGAKAVNLKSRHARRGGPRFHRPQPVTSKTRTKTRTSSCTAGGNGKCPSCRVWVRSSGHPFYIRSLGLRLGPVQQARHIRFITEDTGSGCVFSVSFDISRRCMQLTATNADNAGAERAGIQRL